MQKNNQRKRIQVQILDIEQGSNTWLELRKTKITASDAPIIDGASHFKTKIQLFNEKIGLTTSYQTDRMRRGLELEPIARELFSLKTGICVHPKVIVKDWQLASLDGISECGKYLVEIKCAGKHDHDLALHGRVPSHYYPQLQHQMYVCNLDTMFYFSFDGVDGVALEVLRDDEYLKELNRKEYDFFSCLQNKVAPEPDENDYVENNDPEWQELADRYKRTKEIIEQLEQEQEHNREVLIRMSGNNNTRGAGISVMQVRRKGNIDYARIPELKNVDLDRYRKESSLSWRIS